MLGVDSLPQRWLAALELKDVIERIAKDLYLSFVGEHLNHDACPPN
jgi:hypothetical protein